MNKVFTLLFIFTSTVLPGCSKSLQPDNPAQTLDLQPDNPARIAELDDYWAEVSRCVKEGDFEGYKATCHKDGVLVSGKKNTAYPLSKALKMPLIRLSVESTNSLTIWDYLVGSAISVYRMMVFRPLLRQLWRTTEFRRI